MKKVWAYNTEEGFDRAARAVRYVERLRHGPTDPQPQDPRPSQSTAALVRTKYVGGIAVPSADADQLYPIEVMGYDDETGSWRVLTDPDDDPIVGLASGLNNEVLQSPSDSSQPGTVYVAHLVGYYHWVDDPETVDPSFEQFQGMPLFRVAVGGGVSTGEQYVRITGDNGGSPPLYSGVVSHQTSPNVWADTGTIYTNKIVRPPSNATADVTTPPPIPSNQVVVVEPDPDNPTYFRVKGACGGMVEETATVGPFLTDVAVTAVCNVDNTITITVTKTYKHQDVQITGRDIVVTVGSPY